jgi:hypothetical protein
LLSRNIALSVFDAAPDEAAVVSVVWERPDSVVYDVIPYCCERFRPEQGSDCTSALKMASILRSTSKNG